MNWVDWLILGILAYCALTGFFKGFFRSVSSLIALVLATVAAGRLGWIAGATLGWSAKDPFGAVASSAVVWITVYLVLTVTGIFLSRRLRATWAGKGDRWAGLSFGLIIGLLTVLVPLAFLDAAPVVKQNLAAVAATRRHSILWRALAPLEPPVMTLTSLCFGWQWEDLTNPSLGKAERQMHR